MMNTFGSDDVFFWGGGLGGGLDWCGTPRSPPRLLCVEERIVVLLTDLGTSLAACTKKQGRCGVERPLAEEAW